jgi:hypothetical protein
LIARPRLDAGWLKVSKVFNSVLNPKLLAFAYFDFIAFHPIGSWGFIRLTKDNVSAFVISARPICVSKSFHCGLVLWLFDRTNVRFVFYQNSIKLTKVKINKKKPVKDNHKP